MGEIINLKDARKRKAREDKKAKAAGNRWLFGRSKADKKKAEAEKNKAAKKLDGNKLDKDD